MIGLLQGLKPETIESLANLKGNKDYKKLVEVLRLTQDKYAKLCITRNSWEEVQKLQWETAGISIVIQTVEQAYNKLNKETK